MLPDGDGSPRGTMSAQKVPKLESRWAFRRKGLGRFEVYSRLLATTVGFDLVAQTLFLVQRRHASAFYRGDMDEAVIAAVFGRNEAIAFVGVEEFDGADGHENNLFNKNDRPAKWQARLVAREKEKCQSKAKSVAGDVSDYLMTYPMSKVNLLDGPANDGMKHNLPTAVKQGHGTTSPRNGCHPG